ncbi:acyl-CoA carboxylase subunit beta [Paraburkholderia unamae]|uniref:Acetyl-CoA carboxylase carboxyltransferase component n=1 Tax=Paraburkholderia unamae TaxID=219649 RepID=A0ABX5KVT6_9BURK|nr:carboxyl transferase domain-containing protein [Paraburkholderia unamae]PVX85552.1 acetyl-CoA carboxylase carboxyltransferase component [Paraburkholderia unamae]RAR55239.1 acetyl-CoA carboxylase carboxyltransferase component [Paraburkholderia unamae]CAG9268090.1 Propionyl-CoA carboxylase beta chain [Paraburkholderia unamae]
MNAGLDREVEELQRRHAWAEQMGGVTSVARHHAAGRLTIRERIAHVVDEHSFQEVGKLTGQSIEADADGRKVMPAPYVMGLAQIDGRNVAIGGEDFTVRGGVSWAGDRRKGGQGGFVEDLAYEYRIPLVNLIDGSGGSVTGALKRGHTVFPGVHGFERSVALMDRVPVVSAVLGAAAGGPAGRAVLSHFSVMVRGQSQVFCTGPAVVGRSLGKTPEREALGGSRVAVDTAGTIDQAVDTEEEAFELIRRFLSYLPQHAGQTPPVLPPNDPPGRREEFLLDIVPSDRRRPYDMRLLVSMVVDDDSFFELQPTHGASVICAFARLGGHVVGVIANNPQSGGGALDVHAARKQTRFIGLCDTFHIPLVFFVDIPGFMVGVQAERDGVLRAGMDAVAAAVRARVPKLTVVVRKCYGMGGMATTEKNGLGLKLAWPSAEWGSLPIEGGVDVAFRREIAAADDPAQRRTELEAQLRELASPWATAQAFGVEDIIDPRDTRRYLCRFVSAMQARLAHEAQHRGAVS